MRWSLREHGIVLAGPPPSELVDEVLKDLHTLQTVAEPGSMAKASERLALSQPAISKAISDMEHTLGAALLDRSSRGGELTDCGHLLIERARVVFDEVRQGVSDIESMSDPTRGEIRLGTTEPLTVVASEIVSLLSRKYPPITYLVTIRRENIRRAWPTRLNSGSEAVAEVTTSRQHAVRGHGQTAQRKPAHQTARKELST
jgi:DNA-binding transcriptional LysR family regulator